MHDAGSDIRLYLHQLSKIVRSVEELLGRQLVLVEETRVDLLLLPFWVSFQTCLILTSSWTCILIHLGKRQIIELVPEEVYFLLAADLCVKSVVIIRFCPLLLLRVSDPTVVAVDSSCAFRLNSLDTLLALIANTTWYPHDMRWHSVASHSALRRRHLFLLCI